MTAYAPYQMLLFELQMHQLMIGVALHVGTTTTKPKFKIETRLPYLIEFHRSAITRILISPGDNFGIIVHFY